jgi:hypothetical protein
MRAAVLVVAFSLSAVPVGHAQGGATQYAGYAFVECTATNTPAVRLVLLTGVVPATLPASAPTPNLSLILNGAVDAIVSKKVPLSTGPADAGRIVSCPVVGDCVPAETGAVTIEKRAEDGALSGQFQATWPRFPERTGRFTVAWRDSGKKCG